MRVFSLDTPPRYLHSISEWLARDALSRGEASFLRTDKRVRGIQYVRKSAPDPVTPEKPGSLRTKSVGDAYDHDSPTNVQGFWDYYPFPRTKSERQFVRRVFGAVLNSCVEKAA